MKKIWSPFSAAGVKSLKEAGENKSDNEKTSFSSLGYHKYLLESFERDCKQIDECICILMVMGNQQLPVILEMTRTEIYSLAYNTLQMYGKTKGVEVG